MPRWPAISAWCAIVSVTPEVSSSAVLIGRQRPRAHGRERLDDAGRRRRWRRPPALGQTALKSGHSSAFSRLPRLGSACTRAQYSAPKKAPKNITSEKMNQLMLQRNETSMRSLYRPPSLSPIAWRNQLEQHDGPQHQAGQQHVGAPAGAVDPLAGAEDHEEAGRWPPAPGGATARERSSRASCPWCVAADMFAPESLLDLESCCGVSCGHAAADHPVHQQHQRRRRTATAPSDAGDDHVHRVELRDVLLVVAALAHAEERPGHRLHRLQERALALRRLRRSSPVGHGALRPRAAAGAAGGTLPPTSKKVYDSVIVRHVLRQLRVDHEHHRPLLASRPAASVYSLKQKHSSLLKCAHRLLRRVARDRLRRHRAVLHVVELVHHRGQLARVHLERALRRLEVPRARAHWRRTRP